MSRVSPWLHERTLLGIGSALSDKKLIPNLEGNSVLRVRLTQSRGVCTDVAIDLQGPAYSAKLVSAYMPRKGSTHARCDHDQAYA